MRRHEVMNSVPFPWRPVGFRSVFLVHVMETRDDSGRIIIELILSDSSISPHETG